MDESEDNESVILNELGSQFVQESNAAEDARLVYVTMITRQQVGLVRDLIKNDLKVGKWMQIDKDLTLKCSNRRGEFNILIK